MSLPEDDLLSTPAAGNLYPGDTGELPWETRRAPVQFRVKERVHELA